MSKMELIKERGRRKIRAERRKVEEEERTDDRD